MALHWILFIGVTSRSGALIHSILKHVAVAKNYVSLGVLFNDLESATRTDPIDQNDDETTRRVLGAGLGSVASGIVLYIIMRAYVLREYPKQKDTSVQMKLLSDNM